MKKIYVSGAVIAAIIAVLIGLVALRNPSDPKSTPMSGEAMSANATDAANAVATDTVAIDNFVFSPAVITVKRGTKVTWTNKDSVAHTVVEDDSQTGPQSANLSKGDTFSYTYNQTGTFAYKCGIHPDMKGKVVVLE